MFSRMPSRSGPSIRFGMSGGPPPSDIIALIAVLFVTFSMQFFESTRVVIDLLRLSPDVWRRGFLWQLGTYPFIGRGGPSIWILLELFILYIFAKDVFARLGRRNFWHLVAWAIGAASVCAVIVELLAGSITGEAPFTLIQGQRMLLVIVIAAFATLFGNATIYLFFVLPVQARAFLWIEVLIAFLGFLGSRDLSGFVAVLVAVGLTYNILSRGSLRKLLREGYLRLEQQRIKWKLLRMRKKRGMHVVRDDEKKSDRDPWIH
jgi:hypothetical protein